MLGEESREKILGKIREIVPIGLIGSKELEIQEEGYQSKELNNNKEVSKELDNNKEVFKELENKEVLKEYENK